jgi:PAS domain S-box-containing protein
LPKMTHAEVPASASPPTPGRETLQLREIPKPARPSILRGYAIGIALSLIAFALTIALSQFLDKTIFLLFWPAIVATAWLGGFGPAVLASVIAVGLVDYYVLDPTGLDLTNPGELVAFAAFLIMSVLTSWAVSLVDKARIEAAEAAVVNAKLAKQLDEQSIELTHQLEESQAMQEELEQSSEELAERTNQAEAADLYSRGILESISEPFIVQDSDWKFRYINSAAAGVLSETGFADPRSLIGKVVWEEFPHTRGTKVELEMRNAARSRKPVMFEAFNTERGRWSEIRCYPLPDGGLATHWKDITDRKQAEESSGYLARASELFASSTDYEATLAEIAKLIVPQFADWCAVSIVDGDGEPRQLAVAHVDPAKVEWANELNRRYPPDPNAATGVHQVIRTGRPEIFPEIPDDLLVASAIDDEHLRMMRELGLKSAMVVPLRTPTRILGAITVVSAESRRKYSEDDLAFITELARRSAMAVENARLHKAEQDARHAAESANEAKTQFLAVMSHELRTPLNAIGGYAELLMMGIRGAVTEDQRADLERIQRSQRNLLSLINDILNYAKLEAGHVEFEMIAVPLHPLLMDIEPLITPQLHARSLTYDYTGCGVSLSAWADAEKVRQIMLNLLSNAIKFTEPGGTISIKCSDGGDMLRVIVKDTGLGIPADRLSSVFEPFVQLERRLTSAHEGTGLGLAISRDLARGLGGDLIARSTVGVGSEFELSLKKTEAGNS